MQRERLERATERLRTRAIAAFGDARSSNPTGGSDDRPTRRRSLLASAAIGLLAGCTTATDDSSDDRDGNEDAGDDGATRSDGEDGGDGEQEADAFDGTRIGFVGDVMLARSVEAEHEGGSPEDPWGDLLPRLDSLDGLVGNLECCLSTRGEKFPDRAYYFRANPEWAVPALDRAGFDLLALANNHMLDYGPPALRDTLDSLDDAGIARAGAGATIDEAYAPALVSIDGIDLAVVSFADHFSEYGVTDDRPGTAYLECEVGNDRTRGLVERALTDARSLDPDLVVASVHWGPNWVEFPDEPYREFARYLVDSGVDLVHGHSAHVFQGVEVYDGTPILHDAGDFVDDYVIHEDVQNDRSALFELEIDEGSIDAVRVVPTEIDDQRVHPADDEAAAWIRETMRERSAPFGTEFERADNGDGLIVTIE